MARVPRKKIFNADDIDAGINDVQSQQQFIWDKIKKGDPITEADKIKYQRLEKQRSDIEGQVLKNDKKYDTLAQLSLRYMEKIEQAIDQGMQQGTIGGALGSIATAAWLKTVTLTRHNASFPEYPHRNSSRAHREQVTSAVAGQRRLGLDS